MSKVFFSREALNIEFKRLQKQYPLFEIRNTIIGHYRKKRGSKRQVRVGFKCCIGFNRNSKKVKALENKKGKFIIATNILDGNLTAEELIVHYGGRNKNIEGCFRLLKDSTFKLNQVFLKRIDRIEALMSVMALSLFINNLGQMQLRSSLKETEKTIPNQMGKEIKNPTLKWAFQLMRKVVKVNVRIFGRDFEEFKGLTRVQKTIIDCFGPAARLIYGFP